MFSASWVSRGYVLEEYLKEDAAGGGGGVLCERDAAQHVPVERFGEQEVREEFGDVADLVGLEPVDDGVVFDEEVEEVFLVQVVDLAEALGEQAEELEVGAFLHAAVDDHAAELGFVAAADVELHELVCALVVVDRVHDDQVDRLAQLQQVVFGEVQDLRLRLILDLLEAVVQCGSLELEDVVFAEDADLDLFPLIFSLVEERVETEDVLLLFSAELGVELEVVDDLVFFVDQVELGDNTGVVFELVLADREQVLDTILHLAVDLTFVQDLLEALEDRVDTRGTEVGEHLSSLFHEIAGDVDGVFGGVFDEEHEQLQAEQLAEDFLVDQMREKLAGRIADKLAVALERSAELEDDSADDEVRDVGQLGVEDGDESGVDVGEVRRCHLRFYYCTSYESDAPHKIFVEQFDDHVLDVRDVDLVRLAYFVHDLVDRLPEHLPLDALPLLLVRLRVLHQLFLQPPELVRRHVHAACARREYVQCSVPCAVWSHEGTLGRGLVS